MFDPLVPDPTTRKAAMDKAFHTAHRWELDWEDDVDVLSLRDGVQVKVFYSDPEAGVADMLIKFPPGYTEPEHAHHSSHSILVLEGVQIVKGVHLHPATTSGRPVRSRTARTSTRRAAWSSPRSAACPPSAGTRARRPARSSRLPRASPPDRTAGRRWPTR